MIGAGLTNARRREVYKRDGWRCALCDSTDGLQIHHVEPRGSGGSDMPENLITLCWRCHAEAHGVRLPDAPCSPEDIYQACVEYLSDYYAEDGPWYPWK